MINFFIKKLIGKKNQGKVFVGLSGGVDSSVAAALLKKRGYEVTGVFIKSWHPDFLPCPWKEDRRDAMRVAAKLDIPFLTFNFEKEYEQEVGAYIIKEYKEGRTPNPDVLCNKIIKFGLFLNKAKEMGADYIATGHYSRVLKSKDENFNLLAGVDNTKDQSYFLWTLTQKQLKYILFPIGSLKKTKVRVLAEKFNLSTATKKDSQGICFLGKVEIKDFLKEYLPEKKGDVLDKYNKKIGVHDGAHFYTIGQRHGFEIQKKGTGDSPYYVVGKNIKKNVLVVSQSNIQKKKEKIFLEQVSWVSGKEPNLTKKYHARIRYRQALQVCKIKTVKSKIEVVFEINQTAVASGQSLVIYDKDQCLGGGIIM